MRKLTAEPIGGWVFDAAAGRLVGQGEERRLEDRAARTLALLCERRGDIVSPEEILLAVWNGRAVSPNSVAVVIRDLRRALGDDARQPRFIETIAKRGYRLAAEAQKPPIKSWLTIVAVIAALAAFNLLWQSRVTIAVEPVRNETGQEGYDPLSRALSQVVLDQASKLAGLTVTTAESDARLRLGGRLILWNGMPALSLAATNPDGEVVWTGIAEGDEAVIAKLAAAKIGEMGRSLRHGAGSEE